ncbi:MAG: zinc ribbon domain-containing protein [Desulfamplus sp.]
MPIFEFKCSDCKEFFEVLFMSGDDEKEIKCPKCSSFAVERVVSATNYVMGGAAASKSETVGKQTRNCSSGSCTTYTVPGETRG